MVQAGLSDELAATVYELEKLRCNLCGDVYTAEAPPEAGEKKYDESAAACIHPTTKVSFDDPVISTPSKGRRDRRAAEEEMISAARRGLLLTRQAIGAN